ncbi:MAG: hypothetical protein P1U82_12820 [Verrucomicrobiales bacterium]|nr:hypothetical protein [Verrucomicrobiales bacterium]
MINGNLTADGQLSPDANSRSADTYAFAIYGTWGGGTLKFQGKDKGSSTWFDITSASWTDDVSGVIDVSGSWDIRADLSGSTSPDLNITLRSTSA